MIRITESEYRRNTSNYVGICVSCRHRQDMVEPDAREYTCESCGNVGVFGTEELLMGGDIEIVGRRQSHER